MSDIPSWARVGAKVVSVGYDGPDKRVSGFNEIVRGVVYVIEWVGQGPETGMPCIRVAGQSKPGVYRPRGFRPVRTLEDDITTYFADLLDVREPVGA